VKGNDHRHTLSESRSLHGDGQQRRKGHDLCRVLFPCGRARRTMRGARLLRCPFRLAVILTSPGRPQAFLTATATCWFDSNRSGE